MTDQEINDTVLLSKQCLTATARIKYYIKEKKLTKEEALKKTFPILNDIPISWSSIAKISDSRLLKLLNDRDKIKNKELILNLTPVQKNTIRLLKTKTKESGKNIVTIINSYGCENSNSLVSRSVFASAVGIQTHTLKSHLKKLEQKNLIELKVERDLGINEIYYVRLL